MCRQVMGSLGALEVFRKRSCLCSFTQSWLCSKYGYSLCLYAVQIHVRIKRQFMPLTTLA